MQRHTVDIPDFRDIRDTDGQRGMPFRFSERPHYFAGIFGRAKRAIDRGQNLRESCIGPIAEEPAGEVSIPLQILREKGAVTRNGFQ